MEKDRTPLSGFDTIVTSLSNSSMMDDPMDDDALEEALRNRKSPSVKDVFNIPSDKDDDDLEDEDDIEDDIEDEVEEEEEEEVPVKKTSKKEKTEKSKKVETTEDDDVIENNNEAAQVGLFFDAVAEELGIEFDDSEKPKTVEELVNHFKEMIAEQSVPTYANEQMRELDEFVRNGGKIEDYVQVTAEMDLDKIDLSNENDQRRVVRELLIEKGFSQKAIDKKIAKYEDAGILEDEAEDSLEDLKEIKAQKKEQLIEAQKLAQKQQVEAQTQFVNSIVTGIKELKEVRGVKIPEKDKKPLLEYILKPDTKGMTRFQKEYNQDVVGSLLELAYFKMKGDSLVKSAKQTGNNSAIKNLKEKLNSSSFSRSSKRVEAIPTKNDMFSRAIQQLF